MRVILEFEKFGWGLPRRDKLSPATVKLSIATLTATTLRLKDFKKYKGEKYGINSQFCVGT